jgi:hypothetical protein
MCGGRVLRHQSGIVTRNPTWPCHCSSQVDFISMAVFRLRSSYVNGPINTEVYAVNHATRKYLLFKGNLVKRCSVSATEKQKLSLFLHSWSANLSEQDVACLFFCTTRIGRGPGSSVGIATDYGLDGPGIESR